MWKNGFTFFFFKLGHGPFSVFSIFFFCLAWNENVTVHLLMGASQSKIINRFLNDLSANGTNVFI